MNARGPACLCDVWPISHAGYGELCNASSHFVMSASRLRPLRKGSDHVADLRIKVLGARYFAYWRAKPNVHTIQAVCEYISLELWIPGLPCACLRVFGLRCRGRMSPKGGGWPELCCILSRDVVERMPSCAGSLSEACACWCPCGRCRSRVESSRAE